MIKHNNDFCGEREEIISYYGVEHAIDDGTLHHLWPERWPYLLVSDDLLRNVEAAAVKRPELGSTSQRLVPLIYDAVLEARRLIASGVPADDLLFSLEHTIAGTVWVAANELGGLTVMTPADL